MERVYLQIHQWARSWLAGSSWSITRKPTSKYMTDWKTRFNSNRLLKIFMEPGWCIQFSILLFYKHRLWKYSLILQQYSWGSLMISEEAIRKLCTRFNVFPPFLDTLCRFGQRNTVASDSIGSYHGLLTEDQNFFGEQEICSKLEYKLMESQNLLTFSDTCKSMVGMSLVILGPCDRWAFITKRQYIPLKIYSLYLTLPNSFRADSVNVQQVPSLFCQLPMTFRSYFCHQRQILGRNILVIWNSNSTRSWDARVQYLLRRLTREQKTKANLAAGSQSHGSSEKANSEIQISDAQDIEVLREKLYQLNHVLGMNCQVFQGLKNSLSVPGARRISGTRCSNQFILSVLSDTRSERQRVHNTLQKLRGTSELVSTLSFFFKH